MEPVDVVLLTKNSEAKLEECLGSIYRSIPVGQLIVVDGYSTDKTLAILDKFGKKHGNIKIIYDSGTRATARQKGIGSVETEWFMFVDSDVVLCENWFQKAMKYIEKDVGAVWGIEVWSTIRKPATLKMFLWITRKIFELRGGTHDTLVRFSSIKDIQIPNGLHVFEDAYIKEWITKKGYKVIACYDLYCIHYRPQNVWTLKGSLRIIVDAIRFGGFRLVIKLALAYGFYTAYSAYQMLASRTARD
jgi:glycosyltransferase involved in cell wall biosynthesis